MNFLGYFIFWILLVASDYAIKEKPLLVEDMQGGPDYIVLKELDPDSIRIIGSVLGQSIALDYFVSQVNSFILLVVFYFLYLVWTCIFIHASVKHLSLLHDCDE